jgi:ribonuclease Z
MPDMEITLLGTGSPLPSGNRCGAGQLVVSGDHAVLVDCGWGAARRLIATGFPIGTIENVFFTHMHSDHITDFPDFAMMRWTLGGATTPLHVYGPEGTAEAIGGFRTGLNPDVRYRFAHHGEKLSRDGIEVIVHEIPATPAVSHVASVDGIEVGSFEVDHRPVVPALGFKVEARGRKVVFSGDTVRVQSLVDAAKGADILVSEAVHLGMMRDRITFLRSGNQERMARILEEACDYHAPTHDVAEMARDAGVSKLVLTHLIPPIPNEGPAVEEFVRGMADVFSGELLVAQDMQKVTIGE